MRNSKSKHKKPKKKGVRFKFGDFEAEEINDSEIEDGQIITDDSDQDNKTQPHEATSDNSKAVKKVAVTDTLPTDDMDNTTPTTNSAVNTDSTTKNTDQAVSKTAVTTKNTAPAVSKTAVINKPVSIQGSKQTETATEEKSQSAAEAERTKSSNKLQQQQIPKIPEHPQLTSEDIQRESTEKITKLYIGNITTDTAEEDIMQLFGLNSTAYLRDNSKVQVFYHTNSKFRSYAIVQIFHRYAIELLKLNGLEYKSRKLIVEIAKNLPKFSTDKSILPYDRRGMRRGKNQQGNLDTSKKNKADAVRPAPASSSRQEETHTQSGFWDQSLEAVGEREPNKATKPWRKSCEKNTNARNWRGGNRENCSLGSSVTGVAFPRVLSRMRLWFTPLSRSRWG